MPEHSFSKTALGVAALRAAHQIIDDEPHILEDPIAVRLFPAEALEQMRNEIARLREPGMVSLRTHVVLRSRYSEDRLEEAYRRGVRQFVVLGAGFDTFAYRQPDRARDLRIFEVDHPATQRVKRERLDAAGISAPKNLEYVSIDFETTSLRDGLFASSFDPTQSAFVSCLGVLVYLTEEAVDAVFQLVASFPPSSEIVFTFSPPAKATDAEQAARLAKMAALVESLGEPWRTRLEPEVLTPKLRALGFSEVTFLSGEEAEARYFRGRKDGLKASPRERIASAIVG